MSFKKGVCYEMFLSCIGSVADCFFITACGGGSSTVATTETVKSFKAPENTQPIQ